VNRDGLWHVLNKLGCPENFVNMVKSLHNGMEAQVLDQGSFSDTFNVSNGVKQGCMRTATNPTQYYVHYAYQRRLPQHDAGIQIQ